MTTFYVGQRVRVRTNATYEGLPWIDPRGKEARITSTRGRFMEYEFEIAGALFEANGDELEPILYDGNKTVEWSECLWQPSHQGAPA
jgi:hypothetical protein